MKSMYELNTFMLIRGICYSSGICKYDEGRFVCIGSNRYDKKNWVGCRELHKSLLAFNFLVEKEANVKDIIEEVIPCLYYVSDSFLKWIR